MEAYLDYAANTPVDPRAFRAMKPWLTTKFGNSMAMHSRGQEAKKALEESREAVADLMNAKPTEIVFVSSTTEANNTVFKGMAFANKDKGKHIITSPIEHDCIMNSSRWLQTQGFEIEFVPVDKYGLVDLDYLENAIRKDTILVSIMAANNEIGTIEPIDKIGEICQEHNVPFHTDAAQMYGKLPIDVKRMNIDMMSVSSQKMYGPLGISVLYIRDGIKITPLLHGGGHEFGLRSSTSNVAGAVGFAEAARIAKKVMAKEAIFQAKLRDLLIKNVLKIDNSYLNGHPVKRLPNNANFRFDYIEGEALVMYLDAEGIRATTGSACSSQSLQPSHVLTAIGLKPEQAHGSLRLSVGRFSTKKEIDYTVKFLPKVVDKLREISPFKRG